MIAKTFEIRDKATFIPILAVQLNPGSELDRYLLARAGYGSNHDSQRKYIMLVSLDGGGGPASTDPYDWRNRTRTTAHFYIQDHFNEMISGEVVDVEYILGETQKPKISEAKTEGGK